MTGRNELCPCGSGFKFKKCHGGSARSEGGVDPLLIHLDMKVTPRAELQFSEEVLRAVEPALAVAQNVTFFAECLCRTFAPAVRRFPRAPDDPLEAVKFELERLRVLHGKRFAELMSEFVPSVNGGRLAVAVLLVRAALETTALLVHTERQATELFNAGVRLSELSEKLMPVFKATGGTRFLWDEYLTDPAALLARYAKGLKAEVSPANSATNVLTLLSKLDRFLAETKGTPNGFIVLHYELLSEFCHPNRGAFGLYGNSGGPETDLTVGPTSGYARDFVARIVLPAAMAAVEPAVHSLNQLGAVSSSLGTERVHCVGSHLLGPPVSHEHSPPPVQPRHRVTHACIALR